MTGNKLWEGLYAPTVRRRNPSGRKAPPTTRRHRHYFFPALCAAFTGVGLVFGLWAALPGVGLMLVGVWCGPIFTALFVLGFILIAHFIPVPSPSRSSAEVAALFRDHKNAIRLGMLVAMISFGFIAGWGAAVAARTRQIEGATPVLAYTQIVCAAVGETIVVLMCVVWEVAAFRPEELAPEVTRMLDDVGWFLMVFDWPPFSVWCAALGLAVLHDNGEFARLEARWFPV